MTEDSIGPLPTRMKYADVTVFCPATRDSMYDAVGYQSPGRAIDFPGATILAVENDNQNDSADERQFVGLWGVTGPAVRLPDSEPVPATLGAARARFGNLLVDENMLGADDVDGHRARICRYPRLLLLLDPKDDAKQVSDSATITGIEIDMTASLATIRRLCNRRS